MVIGGGYGRLIGNAKRAWVARSLAHRELNCEQASVFVRGWVSFPSPPRLTIDRKQATSDTHSEQGRSCRTWSGCDLPKRGLDAQPFAWLTLTP